GVAFGKAAKVERHSGALEPDTAATRIEIQFVAADQRFRLVKLARRGIARRAIAESVETHQRIDGDVGSAASLVPIFFRQGRELEEFVADGDWMFRCDSIDAGEFAVGAIGAEDLFEAFDLREGRSERLRGC